MISEQEVIEALRPIKDPEVHISIVDLGLIYGVDIEEDGKKLNVRMTLTSPMCPVGPELVAMVKATAECMEEVDEATVEMVWKPAWDPKEMASDDAKDLLGIW
jgi:metal-sulfur cluster biosynthetic enzyme